MNELRTKLVIAVSNHQREALDFCQRPLEVLSIHGHLEIRGPDNPSVEKLQLLEKQFKAHVDTCVKLKTNQAAYDKYEAMFDSEQVKNLSRKLIEIDNQIAQLKEVSDQIEEELEDLLSPLREQAFNVKLEDKSDERIF